MITQEHIDEWTRHAPAAGLERDLIIAQRAAQLALGKEPEPLVERVADAIAEMATSAGIVDSRPARAAMRAIAADARARAAQAIAADAWAKDLNGRSIPILTWEGVARWLDQEAQQ
jgi:hypothetical protein